MAANWVYLDEALRNTQKYGNLSERYIDYTPDLRNMTIPWDKTFCKEQSAVTEMDMAWHPILLSSEEEEEEEEEDEKEVYLIASHATNFELSLRGYVGYHYIVPCLKKYNRMLYSNKKLGMKGFAITKEMFSNVPRPFRNVGKNCWLANHAHIDDGCSVWGVTAQGDDEVYYLVKGEEVFCQKLAILPLVYVPSNILVNLGNPERNGTTPENALEIKVLRSTSYKKT